jgi:uncharacterized protein YndB with AHSA1/START domain
MKQLFLFLTITMLISFNLSAEVSSSDNHGFVIKIERVVDVDQQTAYQQFLNVGQWWNDEHTWFGKASDMSIDAKAGGCFCEKQGNKEAVHMMVSYVEPNKEIRMTGGLGPLQMLGVHGGMSWKFEQTADNKTKITHHYQVVGYMQGGLKGLAPIVDKVQTTQVEGLVKKLSASQD